MVGVTVSTVEGNADPLRVPFSFAGYWTCYPNTLIFRRSTDDGTNFQVSSFWVAVRQVFI